MAKENIKSKKGFTIIEVVLVLAIAGLIFLMVFVALPALQRSQRDAQRRNDMSRVDTSLSQYQTNNMSSSNSSALPEGPSYWKGSESFNGSTQNFSCKNDVACSFVQRYMNSGTDSATNTFKDPDGEYYSVYITDNFHGGSLTASYGDAKLESAVTTGEGDKQVVTEYTVGTEFDKHIIYIVPGGECDGENVKKSTERHFAVLYRLEGAGVYCIDDQ